MPLAPPPSDLLPVFNAQPGATLLLSPEWVIVAASDDYLAATLTERDTIVGQYIFDAFPDNPDTPEANAVANVRASLAQVLATKQPHEMAPQHYDVPDRAQPGRFVERHWLPRHTPVLDAAGQVQFIIQSVQDITARRVAERLLRDSQASERDARADAHAQRQHLHNVLMALPAMMATYRGPDHVFELVNPRYQQFMPTRHLQGLPIRQALPKLAGQGIFEQLDHVYRTGETHFDPEQETWVDLTDTGRLEQRYFSVLFQALRDGEDRITGLLNFAYDITEQVLARRQLQQLNQELETRVAERTHEAETARAVAVEQRNRLLRLFSQAPAEINLFQGPDHIWTLVHPRTRELLPGRPLQGLPRRQALPELPEELHEPFDRVFRTGQPVHLLETTQRLNHFHNGELHDEYYDLAVQPKFGATGQIEGVMSFALNVTERVRARQQAEALQTEVVATARRQAQEREAFFQVFEQTPALIALLRAPGHRFEFVNPAYQAFFPGRQLLGLEVAVAAPELVAQGFGALLDQVYQTGETFFGAELPFAPPPPAGEAARRQYFNFTYQSYREAGAVAGVTIFAFDVTEQVLARQERAAQQQRLEQLFMQAPAAICILAGPTLVYELVNPGYQDLFPGRQLLGRPLLDALPEIEGNAVYQGFRSVYEQGVTCEAKALLIPLARPGDGVLEDRYFNYIQQPRHDAHGQPDGVLVLAFEVTEQVRARQASEASAQRLQLLTDALPVLISYIDRHETYRFANQAYENWFGLSAVDIVGRHPREVAGETAYQQVRGYIEQALAGQRVEYDARMAYRPGFTKHVHATFIPDVQAGQVVGFYTLVSDVSTQVQAREQVDALNQELAAINEELQATNEELQDSNQQLTRTNVDLDNFIYTASHDLKAPISNIEGLLYLLREELPAEVAQKAEVGPTLVRMLDSVERFKRTIDHLTEVSKLQKENAPATTLVNLAAVVEDVRQDLLPQLQAAGARLFLNVSAQPAVQFSEKNLRSIVYNLLSNAVKYRHPDRTPHIDVRAHVRPGHTVLEVHDNGLGLDPAQLPRLFTMFQRFHDHVEGTGIGLYMVKRMVENAGGRIEVHSQLGAGTTFFVFLPHAAAPAA